MSKKVRRQFRVTPAQALMIEEWAKQEGVSQSEIVRRVIDEITKDSDEPIKTVISVRAQRSPLP